MTSKQRIKRFSIVYFILIFITTLLLISTLYITYLNNEEIHKSKMEILKTRMSKTEEIEKKMESIIHSMEESSDVKIKNTIRKQDLEEYVNITTEKINAALVGVIPIKITPIQIKVHPKYFNIGIITVSLSLDPKEPRESLDVYVKMLEMALESIDKEKIIVKTHKISSTSYDIYYKRIRKWYKTMMILIY